MRLGITGTYSSGKTLTSLALSHFLGMPRTQARTMREILPEAAPGKTLEQVTSEQLVQMIVIRHTERVLHEKLLANEFVSDGCSLQEWIYGSVRVKYGINPNESAEISMQPGSRNTPEIAYFEKIMEELGKFFKRHVEASFDLFIHLPNELPLAKDGHRPVNEKFRSESDVLLKKTFEEIGMKYHIVGGSLDKRLQEIAAITGITPKMEASKAISMAGDQYQLTMI